MENKETAKVVNLTTSNEIASACKNCKETDKYYIEMVSNGIDKETAKSIIKDAKSIINARKETAKTEKATVCNWFADSEKVGKSLLIGFLKDNQFKACKSETEKYKSVREFVENWITKGDANGQPVHKVKGHWQYRELTANNVRAIVRECLNNIIKVDNLQPVKFERIATAEIVTK